MKRLFILIVLIASLVWSFALAADYDDDCLFFLDDNFLSKRADDNDNTTIANLSKAMPEAAIRQAYSNLVAYCCDVKKRECKPSNNDIVYPESVYFFDHLLDVYLRRLDARTGGKNGKDLLYELEPDWSGQEWRNFITERGNNVKWSLPLEIKTKYTAMRSQTTGITTFFGNDQNSIKTRKSDLTAKIAEYDYWTLWDKYNLACDLIKYISEDMLHISSPSLTTAEYNNCKTLTRKRIDNEKIYTQVLLMQKANVLLWSNIKSYLNTYFVADKLNALQDKVFNVSTSFSEVNTAVWELTHDCQS